MQVHPALHLPASCSKHRGDQFTPTSHITTSLHIAAPVHSTSPMTQYLPSHLREVCSLCSAARSHHQSQDPSSSLGRECLVNERELPIDCTAVEEPLHQVWPAVRCSVVEASPAGVCGIPVDAWPPHRSAWTALCEDGAWGSTVRLPCAHGHRRARGRVVAASRRTCPRTQHTWLREWRRREALGQVFTFSLSTSPPNWQALQPASVITS